MEEATSLIDRLKQADRRKVVFVVAGAIVIALALAGVLDASRDVDIEREEAIELARPHIDFEPVNADARLIRQGFEMQPVWAVSFSIPAEENSAREFERLTTVEVHAGSGEVIRIAVDNFDELENDDGG